MALIDDIEAARKRLGVSMDEVARRGGRAASTYTRAVAGKTRVSARTIKAFLQALEEIEREREFVRARAGQVGIQTRRVA